MAQRCVSRLGNVSVNPVIAAETDEETDRKVDAGVPMDDDQD